jgi:L-alanine-DL-glutamate epimerase-like enolase superfamily enzyme
MVDRNTMAGAAAKSVIDTACWDVLGKSTGLPMHVLLGGELVEEPPAFSVLGAVDCFDEWMNPLTAEIPYMQANGQLLPSTLPGKDFGMSKLKCSGSHCSLSASKVQM